ncbi:MAG: sensor histidine kinase [Myxococcota bacterium]
MLFKTIKIKITVIISLTVLIGGLIASIIGTYTVRKTLKSQSFEKIRHDIQSAFALYQSEGERLTSIISLIALNLKIRADSELLSNPSIVDEIKKANSIDFLTIIDKDGNDIFTKKRLSRFPRMNEKSSKEIYSETISNDDMQILLRGNTEKYIIKIIDTPYSYKEKRKTLSDILCITAISEFEYNKNKYYLYGGYILNNNFNFVERIREIIYSQEFYKGKPVGTVTLFSGPIRIATNVLLSENKRAIGTIIQDIVGESVLDRGQEFIGRAFVVNSWYLGAYRRIPTRDNSKAIIYVGLSESVYMSIQSNLILKFLLVSVVSFIMIVIFSYLLISRITKPIERLAELSENISKGDFSKRAEVETNDELGRLIKAFNQMIDSISTSHKMLEEYNLTLQKKVKERTDELMKIKEQMIQSEKLASVGRLSAGIAHEINNPLGAILAYAYLIKEELGSKPDINQIRLFSDNIIAETNRTKNIIKGLLEFARQHKSEYEWVEINQIVEDAINLVTLQKKPTNVEIIKDYGTDIPIVKIDPERIKEAIINIIINALDAMNEYGKLTIKTSIDHKRQQVKISISDTGSGIPEEIMGHIFEPFFTTKPAGKGTGLGLSVTYGIIKQHNGDIVVESKINQGTTFTITLPLHP